MLSYSAATIETHSTPVPEVGCWLWIGQVGRNGYGRLATGSGKYEEAHRASFKAHKGEIPAGLSICHKCDTPTCVNPDHLFAATHGDNMRDAIRKGRHPFVKKLAVAA